MPATPWRQVRPAEPARDYLILLSRLPLARLTALPRFFLAFVAARPHAAVMDAMRGGAIGPTTFVCWRLPGSTLPPSWREAFGRASGPQGRT
jgi:hypothetical protein